MLAQTGPLTISDAAAQTRERWELQSSDEAAVLALLSASDQPAIRLYCPARARRLIVNVPDFEPVGPEERLSIGSGSHSTVLVAESRGDAERSGVTGSGEVPANLDVLIMGPATTIYGSQASVSHCAPPAALARSFGAGAEVAMRPLQLGAFRQPSISELGPCLMQSGKELRVAPIRALALNLAGMRGLKGGLSPIHPEDQTGPRIWTRSTAGEGDEKPLPSGRRRQGADLAGCTFLRSRGFASTLRSGLALLPS